MMALRVKVNGLSAPLATQRLTLTRGIVAAARRMWSDQFVIDAVTLAMYRDTFAIDRNQFVIDTVTLAM